MTPPPGSPTSPPCRTCSGTPGAMERPSWIRESWKGGLTGVDKPPWSTFTELLGLVGQGDFDDSRNVPRWGLDTDGVGRDQLQEPHSAEALSSAGRERRTLASWTQLPKTSKIGPSSWNAPSELSPRLRTYSCVFRKMSANDPGCSLQERPQGIIHMKIATICLLKPAPRNSSTNCFRALGTSDGRFETPGLGRGPEFCTRPLEKPLPWAHCWLSGDRAAGGAVDRTSDGPRTKPRREADRSRGLTSLHTNIVPNTT